MKPIRLDLDGFGTFRDATTLDFSDTDYFALVGPTGAGKTTIIDGLCFALYGTVPRWPRKEQVSLAMAPSVSHTRVALVFDTGGARYGAVRVLARSAKGQVSTKEARLVQLRSDADVTGDIADVLDQAVADLAASPDTVTDTVQKLLGLPWDHFIQCVVLPQGEFTKFLHSQPKDRQEVLVSLLGLAVYDKVAGLARDRARNLAAREEVLRGQLASYADATEDAESRAAERLKRLQGLQRSLPRHSKAVTAAQDSVKETQTTVEQLGEQASALAAARRPAGLDTLLTRHEQAVAARNDAAEKVTIAEKHEEAAETEAEQAGPPHQWQQLVTDHQQHQQLLTDIDAATKKLTEVTSLRDEAEQKSTAAAERSQAARATLEHVRTEHAAADLAQVLQVGQDCPVCLQPVSALPDRPPLPEIENATGEVTAAEQLAQEAGEVYRQAQIAHARAGDELTRLRKDAEKLTTKLEAQPDLEEASRRLQRATETAAAVKKAIATCRSLRRERDGAQQQMGAVNTEIEEARRRFGEIRDPLVRYGAPSPSGELAVDWDALLAWTADQTATVRDQVAAAQKDAQQAAGELQKLVAELIEKLREHGIPVRPNTDPNNFGAHVATAVAEAKSTVADIQRRRREAADLTAKVVQANADATLHRELGVLLDARHFERWLVEEALMLLVADASETLLELSGGQFQLELGERNAIEIVDHNDAGSRRPVRTLSGGETFQAALSLALALSRRTAALSAIPARDLDTILLDEGFGTLDAATLDTVASTLENLSGGGERTVGVVTHVPALAERTQVRFEVTRHGNHSTVTKVAL